MPLLPPPENASYHQQSISLFTAFFEQEPEDALMEPPPPPPSEPVQPVVASTDNQHTDYNTMQGPPIESPPPRMQVEMTV
jgi:hypothetical protein